MRQNSSRQSISSEISATRLIHFKSNLQIIITNPWVIQSVVGYKMPFTSSPRQWHLETVTKGDLGNAQMKESIQFPINKGAAKELKFRPDKFLSRVFLINKKGWQ